MGVALNLTAQLTEFLKNLLLNWYVFQDLWEYCPVLFSGNGKVRNYNSVKKKLKWDAWAYQNYTVAVLRLWLNLPQPWWHWGLECKSVGLPHASSIHSSHQLWLCTGSEVSCAGAITDRGTKSNVTEFVYLLAGKKKCLWSKQKFCFLCR